MALTPLLPLVLSPGFEPGLDASLAHCLYRLGYGNLAGFPSPRSTFVADINLSIPKERGKNGMPVMGEECEGIVFFRPTIPRNGVPLPCPANE